MSLKKVRDDVVNLEIVMNDEEMDYLSFEIQQGMRAQAMGRDQNDMVQKMRGLPNALINAYINRSYIVSIDGENVGLKIGNEVPSSIAELNRSWAIITAFNPHSLEATEQYNQAQQKMLVDMLSLHGYETMPAVGQSDEGNWEEPSLFVLGISCELSKAFGACFRQNAVIFAEADGPIELIFCALDEASETEDSDPIEGGQEQQFVQRCVDAVHSGQALDEADYDEFKKLVNELEPGGDFYNSVSPEFGETDEFGFGAISLDQFVSECRGGELDADDIVWRFRAWNEQDSSSFYFLKKVRAASGRSGWALVQCRIQGQGGSAERMVGLFVSPLAAEDHLRADGYVFDGEVPSGKIDAFTDEQIIEMVHSRQIDEAALARADWYELGDL